MPSRPERPGYALRIVTPSSAVVQVLAGLMLAERLITERTEAASRPASFATATAVPMVPHVPWEWTFGLGVVALPSREQTS